MIQQACPVIVLDDQREELWKVAHGLGFCGFPVTPHLVRDGKLERMPAEPYTGVRLLFTDLHLLGPTGAKPEAYIGALISFIRRLVQPSTYLIVFWSNFVEEHEEAWKILKQRIPAELCPFAYKALPKELAHAACDEDETVAAPAREALRAAVADVINAFPQLRALMSWESTVSRAAAETSNVLLRLLSKGGARFEEPAHVRAVLARMAQEALGYPYAAEASTRGLIQALIPMVQDRLERHTDNELAELKGFLAIEGDGRVELPSVQLNALLNDFFIHAEGDVKDALDRGAVVRLDPKYLDDRDGFARDVGLANGDVDWREAICSEFYPGWKKKSGDALAKATKAGLSAESIYAIELSAICDHAQNKQRSQRFLLGLFVEEGVAAFGNKMLANDAIYATPGITIGGKAGRLFISCRILITRPYGQVVSGIAVTRLRKDVVDELSHTYST
jgi:hypothetical protein